LGGECQSIESCEKYEKHWIESLNKEWEKKLGLIIFAKNMKRVNP
jgi:hypothetical protein